MARPDVAAAAPARNNNNAVGLVNKTTPSVTAFFFRLSENIPTTTLLLLVLVQSCHLAKPTGLARRNVKPQFSKYLARIFGNFVGWLVLMIFFLDSHVCGKNLLTATSSTKFRFYIHPTTASLVTNGEIPRQTICVSFLL